MTIAATITLIIIIWLFVSYSRARQHSEARITAESLYIQICNLLQNNKTYKNLLEKITNSIKPEYYTHENEEIYWEEQTFPDLIFHAKKNYNEDDYSLYIFSNHRSITKKYFGFMVYLNSPECAEEQTSFRNMWTISADDSMLGYKAKSAAIALGKALCDVVNSHNHIADFSRNWQPPTISL